MNVEYTFRDLGELQRCSVLEFAKTGRHSGTTKGDLGNHELSWVTERSKGMELRSTYRCSRMSTEDVRGKGSSIEMQLV